MDIFLLVLLGLAVWLFYLWASSNNNFFKGKPLPYIKPVLFFGSSVDCTSQQVSMPDHVVNLYNKFPHEKIFGYFDFRTPVYMLRDPELLAKIAVNDFDYFVDHRIFFNPKSDPLMGRCLLGLTGAKWKATRATINPVFASDKMQQMFELMPRCGENMTKALRKGGLQSHDMQDLFYRYTLDVTATCAFGTDLNSFEEPDEFFIGLSKQLASANTLESTFKTVGYSVAPMLMKLLQVGAIDSDATEFFRKVLQANFAIRESENINRPDFINNLLQLKQDKAVKSDEELMAHCLSFLMAGLGTTSTLLHFVAYELALNPLVQTTLAAEIQATYRELKGQSLTLEALQKMVYLDLVILEGLRKWPPVPIVDRVCTDDYQLHIDDQRSVIFDKGQLISIPIYAYHHDPNIFPNPEKFDPDRFIGENKHKIRNGAFIPFGTGPRCCVGSRFALLEAKTALYYLLLDFSLEVNATTQVPLEIKKGTSGLASESGVHLDLVPRNS